MLLAWEGCSPTRVYPGVQGNTLRSGNCYWPKGTRESICLGPEERGQGDQALKAEYEFRKRTSPNHDVDILFL